MGNENEGKNAQKKEEWKTNPNLTMTIQKSDEAWKTNKKMVMHLEESAKENADNKQE